MKIRRVRDRGKKNEKERRGTNTKVNDKRVPSSLLFFLWRCAAPPLPLCGSILLSLSLVVVAASCGAGRLLFLEKRERVPPQRDRDRRVPNQRKIRNNHKQRERRGAPREGGQNHHQREEEEDAERTDPPRHKATENRKHKKKEHHQKRERDE